MRARSPLFAAAVLLSSASTVFAQRVTEVAPLETTVTGSNGFSIQSPGVNGAVLSVPTLTPPLSQPSITADVIPVGAAPILLANPVVNADQPLVSVLTNGGGVVSARKPGHVAIAKASPASVVATKAAKVSVGVAQGSADDAMRNALLQLGEGDADARTAKALALIRETEADWTQESREKETATPTEFAKYHLYNRGMTLRKATKQGSFGLIEGLVVKAGFAAQSKLNFWRSESLRGKELSVGDLVSSYFSPIDRRRRGMLRELKEYVPGLDPELVVKGELIASFEAIGYSIDLRDRDGIKNVVWLRKFAHDSDFIWTAAHEGFHQGDLGYAAGNSHFKRMFGDKGADLAVALLEGYTEFRAREALRRLTADAKAGAKGLPQTYASALSSQYGADLAKAAARRDENDTFHPYHPFVRMVEAVMEKPGGREALDAFVANGTVSDLVRILGYDTLDSLGDVAAATRTGNWSEFEAAIAETSGLQSWILGSLEKVVRGEKIPDPREMTRLRDAVVKRAASSVGRFAFSPSSAWRLRGIRRLDLRAALEAGESLSQLLARVDEAAKVPFYKYFMPPPAQSITNALTSGQFAAAAALTPGLMAFAYLRMLLGPGLFAHFIGVYAAALGLWLGAEIVSGVLIAWFPTRNLMNRWSRPSR